MFDCRQQRRAVIRNLWPQRHGAHCRHLLKSTLRDCRALERPFGRKGLQG